MSNENKLCPSCNSARIIMQRHDTDWGSGHDTHWVNPDGCYEEFDQDAGGDINIYICIACDYTWQVFGQKDYFSSLRAELARVTAERDALKQEAEHVDYRKDRGCTHETRR